MTVSKLKSLMNSTPRNVLERMQHDFRISSSILEQEGDGSMPEDWSEAIDSLPETRKLEAVETIAPGIVALAYELLSKTIRAMPAEDTFNRCFHSLMNAKVGEEIDCAVLRELNDAILKLSSQSTHTWIGREALTEMIKKHLETGSTKLRVTEKHRYFLEGLELAQGVLDPQMSRTDRIRLYEQVIKHLKKSIGFFSKIAGAEDLVMRLAVNLSGLKNKEYQERHFERLRHGRF